LVGEYIEYIPSVVTFVWQPVKNRPNAQNMAQNSPQKRKNATFYISESVIALIERAAYWDRMAKGEVVEEAVKQMLAEKQYDPVPKTNR
jgi:hypothetical protein